MVRALDWQSGNREVAASRFRLSVFFSPCITPSSRRNGDDYGKVSCSHTMCLSPSYVNEECFPTTVNDCRQY